MNNIKLTEKELVNLLESVTKKVIKDLKKIQSVPYNSPDIMQNDMLIEHPLISEGLIKTYPVKETREYVVSRIGQKEREGIGMMNISGTFNVSFKNGFKNFSWFTLNQMIITPFKTCGYHIGLFKINDSVLKLNENTFSEAKDKYVLLTFEPIYPNKVEPNDLPNILYHICPTRIVSKIINRVGLTPRGYGKVGAHPERIYFFCNDVSRKWKDIAYGFKEKMNIDEKYSLLEINVESIKNKVDFYKDINSFSEKAVYTLEPIPHNLIKIIDNE
jgi:hypothetical protein